MHWECFKTTWAIINTYIITSIICDLLQYMCWLSLRACPPGWTAPFGPSASLFSDLFSSHYPKSTRCLESWNDEGRLIRVGRLIQFLSAGAWGKSPSAVSGGAAGMRWRASILFWPVFSVLIPLLRRIILPPRFLRFPCSTTSSPNACTEINTHTTNEVPKHSHHILLSTQEMNAVMHVTADQLVRLPYIVPKKSSAFSHIAIQTISWSGMTTTTPTQKKHIAFRLLLKSSHLHQNLAPLVKFEAHHEPPSHMDLVKLSCDSAVMRCRWIYCLWAYAADKDIQISVLATFKAHSFQMCAKRAGTSALLHSQLFCSRTQFKVLWHRFIWEVLWDCSQVHLRHESYFLLVNRVHHVKRIWLICFHTHLTWL